MVHLEQCETPLLMCSSWMFLDSTHQFDEILGISSLTNSHQFLDVLGFYSPIWWNLRNIKSHQFSPGISQSTGSSPSKPSGRTWTVGNSLVRRPGKNPPKAWTWCSLAKNRGVFGVLLSAFRVSFLFFLAVLCALGCFVNMKIRMSLLCCHERLKPHFPTGNGHLGDISMVLICINHSFSKKTRVEIWPMDAEAPLPGVSRHLGRWRESSSSNLVLSWDGHVVGDCPKLDISRHI